MTTDVLRQARYRAEQPLGTGAMGTVLLARDTVLDRRVAVKVLADHLAADDAFHQRFLREARLAARLCHPNIVQVFDAGEDEDGRPFLVMEHVDGETVADRLARGPSFSAEEVVTLATGLAAGLAHAHAMGIVHRDVKPHNVLLGPGGEAKLTDFGIARAREDHGLTEIGTVLGTAPFMAPEQAAGTPVGPPADVFGLGALLRQVAGGSPPAGLEPLIEAALAREPAARPSAAELHARLSALNPAAPTEISHPRGARWTEIGRAPVTETAEAAPTQVTLSLPPTEIATPPASGHGLATIERPLWRSPGVVALAALAVILLVLAVFPRENGTAGVAPVPAGGDPAQNARNLATWLREQAEPAN